MILTDVHTHSHFSPDGQETMNDLCEAACARGLSVMCVTDHYDRDGRFDPVAYRSEYERAREAFAGKVEFLCGVELGEGHFAPERSDRLLEAIPFDFVLGSCHYIDEGQADFHGMTYESEGQCRRLIGAYLDHLLCMIDWGKFDVLAHLTYPLRYMVSREGFNVDFVPYEDQVCAVFRALAQSGHGLELNVSGLRQGGFPMPDLRLLKLYRACGGEIVTIGSDAHLVEAVGANIEDGYALLRQAGFAHVAVFRGRKASFVKI